MCKIGFLIALLLTIQIINVKNGAKGTDESLQFTRADSMVIFFSLVSAFLIDIFCEKYLSSIYIYIVLAATAIYFLLFIIVNINREKNIKNKHEQIYKVYQSCADILGRKDIEDIDYDNIPFSIEEDEKTGCISTIKFDTSIPGGKFNDNTIILAQYSINKFFPEFQWTSIVDYPKREVTFKGLPKPPDIAMFPGSDYRPTGWIPLGLTGKGEIGWNLSGPKDVGHSSFVNEEGKMAETVEMPSAPQCLTLGSTGGGKSIWVDQIVEIKD